MKLFRTMKYIVFFVIWACALLYLFACCTPQQKARTYGGTQTIEVRKGWKVTEATWKDDGNLWYLMEPMDSDYVPKVKSFKESSVWGVMQGEVIFKESR
jgi:hypothetical protein